MYRKDINISDKVNKLVINDILKISTPIVFLCGPFYTANYPDRRYVLFQHIKKQKNAIPLIIDNMVPDPKEIESKNLDIQLLEEIFALVSPYTLIFLDTLSSATELGLFSNNSNKNNIVVFKPREIDIIHQRIGDFIKKNFLSGANPRITSITYSPSIKRYMISTNIYEERYSFYNDLLPEQIMTFVDNITSETVKFILKEDTRIPEKFGVINYSITHTENRFFIKMAVSTLFYVIAAINRLFCKEKELLSVNEIHEKLDIIINNTLLINKKTTECKLISYDFILNRPIETIIIHILKFLEIYNSEIKDKPILSDYKDILKLKIKNHTHDINSLLKLTLSEMKEINRCIKDPDLYFEELKIKTGKKVRNIVKYKDDFKGIKIRKIHEKILENISEFYSFSDNSYAYRKGYNIKKCVEAHINSKHFIKYDIKDFFGSIKKTILHEKIVDIFSKDYVLSTKDKEVLRLIISSCFFKSKLPLGLVTSPLFSDIYLNDFDFVLNSLCVKNKIVYTRYADDILFSSSRFSDNLKKELKETINHELNKIDLEINVQKTRKIILNNPGDHFKFLGINIVAKKRKNMITIGKTYIRNVAKDYVNLRRDSIQDEYLNQKNLGQIQFIKQICGNDGYKNLLKVIEHYSGGKFLF